jgi:predicted DNA-binding transcriptional regulator AlpA
MKTPTQPDAPPLRLWTAEQVGELLGVAKSHVAYLRRVDPSFPRPLKLGGAFNSAVRFPAHEVEAWIGARLAAREADAARVKARGAEMAARLNAQLPPGTRRGGRKRKAEAARADAMSTAT